MSATLGQALPVSFVGHAWRARALLMPSGVSFKDFTRGSSVARAFASGRYQGTHGCLGGDIVVHGAFLGHIGISCSVVA